MLDDARREADRLKAEAGAFARPRTEAPAAPEDDSDKRKSGLFRRK